MIKRTKVLSDADFRNLNGNNVYVTMLQNKVSVTDEIPEGSLNDSSTVRSMILDFVKESTEDLVYYNVEGMQGFVNIDIYFHNAMDLENFTHFYNTATALDVIKN